MPKQYRKKTEYRQGIFKLLPESKCCNEKPVEYRSQLEFNFFTLLEKSPNIIKWSSEEIRIPYINPERTKEERRPIKNNYYVDLYLETVNHGTLLVEIKPQKEIDAIKKYREKGITPKRTKSKKESTYQYELKMFSINNAKWAYAERFAEKRGWRFICVSEKNLKERNVPFL